MRPRKDWEEWKDLLYTLFIEEEYTVKEIVDYMRERKQFTASRKDGGLCCDVLAVFCTYRKCSTLPHKRALLYRQM
ncbi:hypothetical protein BJ508DRAFT_327523 [Ascobolus immersus RN42]|uniref:Clr5 domain-containing protein n=1 Tax=Ascobolus immersus RN42 TaxID=1160509 RepID=A0A3N4I2I6_ASCIM|nr:hypothetical protein BJ508DRAFT_327523 [Ascobolus immersus RN42]